MASCCPCGSLLQAHMSGEAPGLLALCPCRLCASRRAGVTLTERTGRGSCLLPSKQTYWNFSLVCISVSVLADSFPHCKDSLSKYFYFLELNLSFWPMCQVGGEPHRVLEEFCTPPPGKRPLVPGFPLGPSYRPFPRHPLRPAFASPNCSHLSAIAKAPWAQLACLSSFRPFPFISSVGILYT